MKTLKDVKKGECAYIESFDKDTRFLSRVLSKGFRIGGKIEVIRNSLGVPLLLFVGDTRIAISKHEAKRIYVKRQES